MDNHLRNQKSLKASKSSVLLENDQAKRILRKAPNELKRPVKERTAERGISKGSLKQEAKDRRWEEEPLEESLRLIGRAKREWESLVDSLPQLICLVDDQGYILRTNRTVERWNLGQVANLRGKRIHEFFHPGCVDQACYLEVFWSLAWEELNYGRPTECEVKDRLLERHLHIQVRPISPKIFTKGEDMAGYAVVFVNDVTERKQTEREIIALEEQQRQSQKMEAIARLAGRIAHDFKNLLTPIGGFAELAMRALSPNDPMYNDLQEIQKGTERAKTLIHHLTAFSRRQPLNPQVVNLNHLLLNMDETLHHLIGERIELVTLPKSDLGPVKMDPSQFEQMIINLAINARDAMPHGGKLILETSNVMLTQDYAYQHAGMTPGRYVMVAVSDTGTGMTDEVKAHLFEPFFTTKGMTAGTGLGLSTVYGIVKQSSGYILVYSELGHGTIFKIYLPASDEEANVQPRGEVVGTLPRGNETVLLVEDEPLVRGLASRVLREQGYKVLEAANGAEAMRLVQMHAGEEIHVLLTDVVMPGMNGRELAENLESLLPKMKALYMSGYTDQAMVHHGVLEKGMNYIEKPFRVDGLARKVREVLDK
jgi:two-component system cell cycle sensor histidine kinase/response regulator CckA